MGIAMAINLVRHYNNVNYDTTSMLLRGGVNLIVLFRGTVAYRGKGHGKNSCESGFAMIYMANTPDVNIGLLSLKFVVGNTNNEIDFVRMNGDGDGDSEIGCKERKKKGGQVKRR